jgi:hypothetical protein
MHSSPAWELLTTPSAPRKPLPEKPDGCVSFAAFQAFVQRLPTLGEINQRINQLSNERQRIWAQRRALISESSVATNFYHMVGEDLTSTKRVNAIEGELENLFLYKRMVLAANGVSYIIA